MVQRIDMRMQTCSAFLRGCRPARPVNRRVYGAVPSRDEDLSVTGRNGRSEYRMATNGGELFSIAPHTTRDSGKPGRAESGRLDDCGTLYRNADDVSLKLHQPVVDACTAVDTESLERNAAARAHRREHVTGTICHRLERGSHEMSAAAAARESDDHSARLGLPVRRAESGQCRDEVHSIIRFQTSRHRFRVGGCRQKPETVSQPLYRRTCDEDRAFEGVRVSASRVARDRCKYSLTRSGPHLPRVEKEKSTGAVRVLPFSGIDAALPEERCLLIACDAADRHPRAEMFS